MSDEKLELARSSFIIDNYPDYDFTPANWEAKQLGMFRIIASPFADAFQPEYNKYACDRIQAAKEYICDEKIFEQLDGHCKIKDSDDQLKQKHDARMKCRNIRAIESFSNCKNLTYDRWIKSNAIDHTKQQNQMIRGAKTCADIYNKRHKKSLFKNRKSSSKKINRRGRKSKSR
jgi:uncharacterized protein YbbC (DUF1343 family)